MSEQESTALAERPKQTEIATTEIATTSPEEFARAFDAYIEMQRIIDTRMPDAIMEFQGKKFRKKAFWRAVAVAFNVEVEVLNEEFFETSDDWGYRVTCEASRNGRSAVGDGTCTASEKPGKNQATHHNVRSHAHTRAFNRAVSNLVGFGEVSAEEINSERRASGSSSNKPKSSGSSDRSWDGNLVLKSGKHKGKKWRDLPQDFIEFLVDKGNALAAKELGRRAQVEASESEAVEGEVVDDEPELPMEGPPPDDPRFQE